MRDPKAISLQMLLASPRNTNTSGRGFEVEAFERAFLSPMHKKVTTLKDLQRRGLLSFYLGLSQKELKPLGVSVGFFFLFFYSNTRQPYSGHLLGHQG